MRQLRNRREEIISAARYLFLENGYNDTTVESIARHAGYSKRSVYLDFPKKDDLFITICNEGLAIMRDMFVQIPGDIVFADYVQRYLETIATFSHEHAEFFRLLTSEVTPGITANCSPDIRLEGKELERVGITFLAQAIERAMQDGIILKGNALEMAEVIIGAVVGIITISQGASQVMLSPDEMQQKVRTLGRIVCRGLIG